MLCRSNIPILSNHEIPKILILTFLRRKAGSASGAFSRPVLWLTA